MVQQQERPLKKKNYLIKKINLIWIVFIQKNFYQQFPKKKNLNYRFANNCSAFYLIVLLN